MFRILLPLLIVFCSLPLLAQDPPKVEMIERRNSAGQLVERYKTVDGKREGKYESWHDNGKQAQVGEYEDGQQTGEWVSYHENGDVSFKRSYTRGEINGVAVSYYKSGAKRIEGTFAEGYAEGPWTEYYENGKVSTQGEAYTSWHNELYGPKKTGPWKWYHENGVLSLEGSYEQDILTGHAISYYNNGNKRIECDFIDGYAKGEWIEYYASGQVSARGEAYTSWHNQLYGAKKTGPWKWYHENGVLSLEGSYEQDILTGHAISYYNNGNKRIECDFTDGYAKGEWIEYHANGQVSVRGEAYTSWHNQLYGAKKTGHWKWFNESGVLILESPFVEDQMQGHAVRYYSSGEKQVECDFDTGYAKGEWTEYHLNGNVSAKGQASSSWHNQFYDPIREGTWVWNFESGQKRLEVPYVSNVRNGNLLEYYASGNLRVDCEFDNGSLTSTWTLYHQNEQIAAIGEAMGQKWDSHNHPIRTGLWAEYFEDGVRSFEGTYVNGNLDGPASWYHRNGQKSLLTEWIEGVMRGSWTAWHDNGNQRGHGYCYGASWDSPNHPLKQGPWAWYHGNGKKESEGRYVRDVKVGPWIYYDAEGRVKEVHNYINGESRAVSEAVLEDGSRIIRTSNPDGSSDTWKIDKDGNIVDHQHTLPPDKQKPSITYTDPDTGETTTLTHDGDGNTKITKGKTTKDEDGTTHTHEEDDDGTVRDITTHPDGSREFREVRPDGTVRESTRDKNGNIVRKQTNPDGTTTEYTLSPDGRKTRTLRDAEGNIIEEAERTPVGVETVKKPDGTEIRRHRNDDGNWVETTTRPDGTTSRVVRDKDGNIISRDDKWGEREEGQSLYEDVQGGRNWDQLTPEEQAGYADLENRMKENGQLDEARRSALEGDMRRRDEARADTDAALDEAGGDLQRKPATDGAKKPEGGFTMDELGIAAKALELALRMPDVPFEQIQEDLKNAIDSKDKAKIAELLAQDRNSLPNWLEKNSDIAQKWTQAVKSGGSAIASALAVSKAVDHLFKGEYGAALEEFAGANASAFGAIPPDTMTRIERELGRNPANYASALKSLIAFGREVSRPLADGESRNYGKLAKDGIEFMVNAWKALPEEQRNHLLERNLPSMRKLLEHMDGGVRGSAVKRSGVVMGLVDSAPEVFKLLSEWGGENDVANITALTQKVGPKVIGMLVQAGTRSETAGAAAEFMAQLGTDYMAHLGNDAREAAKAAMLQAGTEANSYANLRNTMRNLAQKAGMSPRDAEQYEFLSNLVSGHESRLVLGDMRRAKDVLGVHEAMQAWRRVDTDLGKQAGAVGFFYGGLVDKKSRSSADERAYQIWKTNQVNNARRTAAHIKSILPDYAPGSAAHKFLSHWKNDLEGMVRTFG
jgi:YD repeat-containing protein